MKPKANFRGLAAAILVLIPLALIQCDKDNDTPANTATSPEGSGSLSVSITASPATGRAPLEVAFTSTVSGGKGNYVYSWSFGDGSASSEANPRVRFTSGGTFDVILRVVSGSEVAVTSPLSVRVDGDVRVACFIEPEEGSAPMTVSFGADAAGGNGQVGYLWRFGDGATSSDRATQHLYSSPGTYLASLTVTSGAATGTCVDEIHVFGPLVPECKAHHTGPSSVKFNVVPNYCFKGGCTYEWDFGDGAKEGIERPLHTYGAPGTYTATATVRSAAAVGTCSITVGVN